MTSLNLHLVIVNTLACSLIGLSTMLSLYFFNFLMKRPMMPSIPKLIDQDSHSKQTNGVSNKSISKSSNSHSLSTSSHSSSKSSSSSQNNNSSLSSTKSHVDESTETKSDTHQPKWMKIVLSFAVGGLLGDVFLHLLPEAASHLESQNYSISDIQRYLGGYIIVGIIVFLLFESIFTQVFAIDEDQKEQTEMSIKVTGYMNLMANAFDNFSHGLSVGASFLVGYKTGCFTTLAIIIHEIPHEIADHAILIRSGFSIWEAFKAQMSICLVTIMGAIVVLVCGSSDETVNLTLWILPLTAGGFIYISLGTLLPEVLDFSDIDYEAERKYSKLSPRAVKGRAITLRILFMLIGIFTMAAVNALF